MYKITSLMTSLHEGHKAEERLKCIDNMLFNKCEDTKDTILQAFWWYRKHSIPLDRIKQAKEEIHDLKKSDCAFNCGHIAIELAEEILDKLITGVEE